MLNDCEGLLMMVNGNQHIFDNYLNKYGPQYMYIYIYNYINYIFTYYT